MSYNRLNRLSFLQFVLLFSVFVVWSCKSPTQAELIKVEIPDTTVADWFGDHNGIVTQAELDFVIRYFDENVQAWCVGTIISVYRDSNVTQIPADSVKKSFESVKLSGPYTSEQELRDAFEGVGIRMPYVGVYVIEQNEQYMIVRFYRVPGPNISGSQWVELIIINSG